MPATYICKTSYWRKDSVDNMYALWVNEHAEWSGHEMHIIMTWGIQWIWWKSSISRAGRCTQNACIYRGSITRTLEAYITSCMVLVLGISLHQLCMPYQPSWSCMMRPVASYWSWVQALVAGLSMMVTDTLHAHCITICTACPCNIGFFNWCIYIHVHVVKYNIITAIQVCPVMFMYKEHNGNKDHIIIPYENNILHWDLALVLLLHWDICR